MLVASEDWLDTRNTWSKERLSRRHAIWIETTKKRLKRAYPPAERRFCVIVDKMKFRLPERAKKLLWYQRQKQFLVSPEFVYFGDFYFRALKSLVEIDGSSHVGNNNDAIRTHLLSSHNIRVVRFDNADVLHGDFWDVEEKLIRELCDQSGRGRSKRIVRQSYWKMRKQRSDLYPP